MLEGYRLIYDEIVKVAGFWLWVLILYDIPFTQGVSAFSSLTMSFIHQILPDCYSCDRVHRTVIRLVYLFW